MRLEHFPGDGQDATRKPALAPCLALAAQGDPAGEVSGGALARAASSEVGRLLDQVARLLRRAFDTRARTIGVTRVQWQALMALSRHEGIGQSQLAEILEVEPITVSRLVNRLEASGHVVRHLNPLDRRAYRLALTDKAKHELETLSPLAEECLEDALVGLAPQETAFLAQLLGRVRHNLRVTRLGID